MFNMFRKKSKPKTPHILFTLKFNLTAIAKWLKDPQIIPPDDKWDSYAGYEELSFNITLLPNSEPFLFYHNDANEFSPHMRGTTFNSDLIPERHGMWGVSWSWENDGIFLYVESLESKKQHLIMFVPESKFWRLIAGESHPDPFGAKPAVIGIEVAADTECPTVWSYDNSYSIEFCNALGRFAVLAPLPSETVLYKGSMGKLSQR